MAKAEEGKAQQLIQALYEYYMDHTDQMPVEYRRMFESGKEKKGRVVCDYIAGMSDGYAIDRFEESICAEGMEGTLKGGFHVLSRRHRGRSTNEK